MKSKTEAYDNNYISNKNKTIFLTNFYNEIDYEFEGDVIKDLTLCISFDDPITKGLGYVCCDIAYNDLFYSMEEYNNKLIGYYFIADVGFNNLFYFPKREGTARTSTDEIYKWGTNYKLTEKTFFHEDIRKIMSSNYLDYIQNNSVYDEMYINGKNSSDQYFIVNDEKFNFSIYPIILNNLRGQKEHIMSIIYVYNKQLYFDELDKYESSLTIKIILELLIFIIFGYGLLYIIYLTYNILSKYIVIPIKNVIYMLKGINIGGKNRINYLNLLKKKRDENLEKLEASYIFENKKNNNKENNDDYNSLGLTNIELIKDKIDNSDELNQKYDEESKYIEQELNFYDFDDQLLKYRPLEIENLMKSLMNIKSALILTSKDKGIDQIINYSYSEKIFRGFRNKDGSIICESNIGNMLSQLLKFDKAIYHLVLSIQDSNLTKFLNQNLGDELDSDDSLLNKISNLYNAKKKDKINILVEKQMNNSKINFSQKLIGILINIRYCRLINAYYKFFKNMQKMRKLNYDNLIRQFVNKEYYNINYYHKIIIQFIFLSYIKNDIVKIGESILDYLEFLIKFKFKTSSEDKYFYKIFNRNNPEFHLKQKNKKRIFDKIIKWFNLFDDYISYVKMNSSINDSKCIANDYSHSLNTENFEFSLESQTAFMFQINIQKNNFLKGKFCLYCKNYNDALFYFINAAKKNCIVIDGLIKKRSFKHIFKLLKKMDKKYKKLGLKKLNLNTEIKRYKTDQNKNHDKTLKIVHKTTNRSEKLQYKNNKTFGEEIEVIETDILEDISQCNSKQEKDIIILIDLNIYNKKDENLLTKSSKIDTFIEETIIILNNYLSENDRLCVLIYKNEHKVICPLMNRNK